MSKRKTHEEFMEDFSKKGNPNIEIISDYINMSENITVRCKQYGHVFDTKPSKLLRGDGCSICSGRRLIPKVNSLAVLRPDLLQYFVNVMDAYNTTHSSGRSIRVKCPDCGAIKNMYVYDLNTRGFSCIECSDGISYPNKFIRGVMKQLKEQVDCLEYEWVPEWTNARRYDVYFTKCGNRYVIEMQGEQHYGTGWSWNRQIDDVIKDDMEKINEAEVHHVTPIVIDARVSSSEFITDNIKQSILSSLFSLSKINWEECALFATKNIIKEVCYVFNHADDIAIKDLANMFFITPKTVYNYLKIGDKFGWCDYYSGKLSRKQVRVFDNDRNVIGCYASMAECSRQLSYIYKLNFSTSGISRACKTGYAHHGLYFEYA